MITIRMCAVTTTESITAETAAATDAGSIRADKIQIQRIRERQKKGSLKDVSLSVCPALQTVLFRTQTGDCIWQRLFFIVWMKMKADSVEISCLPCKAGFFIVY